MRVLTATMLVSACALAFAAPASAQFAATVGTGYSHISLSNGGGDGNIWNIDGSADASIPGTGFNFQGNLGYDNVSGGGASANGWNGGGAAFWADDMLRIGATVNYDSFDANDAGSIHFTNYGGFAEWFAGMFTLGVKGGGVSLSASASGLGSGSTTGSYVGGEVAAYAMPDLALSGTVDYASISGLHETDFTPQVEWLFSENVPVSVYAGYTYSNLGGGGASENANTFFIGVRLYVNGNGSAALIDRQRTGVVGWGTAFSPLARAL